MWFKWLLWSDCQLVSSELGYFNIDENIDILAFSLLFLNFFVGLFYSPFHHVSICHSLKQMNALYYILIHTSIVNVFWIIVHVRFVCKISIFLLNYACCSCYLCGLAPFKGSQRYDPPPPSNFVTIASNLLIDICDVLMLLYELLHLM